MNKKTEESSSLGENGDGRQFFSTYPLLNDTPGRSTKVKKTRETRRIAGKKESADKKSAEEAQENKN